MSEDLGSFFAKRKAKASKKKGAIKLDEVAQSLEHNLRFDETDAANADSKEPNFLSKQQDEDGEWIQYDVAKPAVENVGIGVFNYNEQVEQAYIAEERQQQAERAKTWQKSVEPEPVKEESPVPQPEPPKPVTAPVSVPAAYRPPNARANYQAPGSRGPVRKLDIENEELFPSLGQADQMEKEKDEKPAKPRAWGAPQPQVQQQQVQQIPQVPQTKEPTPVQRNAPEDPIPPQHERQHQERQERRFEPQHQERRFEPENPPQQQNWRRDEAPQHERQIHQERRFEPPQHERQERRFEPENPAQQQNWRRDDRPRDNFRDRDDRPNFRDDRPRDNFRDRDDRPRDNFRDRDDRPRDNFRDDRRGPPQQQGPRGTGMFNARGEEIVERAPSDQGSWRRQAGNTVNQVVRPPSPPPQRQERQERQEQGKDSQEQGKEDHPPRQAPPPKPEVTNWRSESKPLPPLQQEDRPQRDHQDRPPREHHQNRDHQDRPPHREHRDHQNRDHHQNRDRDHHRGERRDHHRPERRNDAPANENRSWRRDGPPQQQQNVQERQNLRQNDQEQQNVRQDDAASPQNLSQDEAAPPQQQNLSQEQGPESEDWNIVSAKPKKETKRPGPAKSGGAYVPPNRR